MSLSFTPPQCFHVKFTCTCDRHRFVMIMPLPGIYRAPHRFFCLEGVGWTQMIYWFLKCLVIFTVDDYMPMPQLPHGLQIGCCNSPPPQLLAPVDWRLIPHRHRWLYGLGQPYNHTFVSGLDTVPIIWYHDLT